VQNKRRVFIIGASDFGREIEGWLELTPHNQRDWNIAGYLDRNSDALKGCQSDYDVVGEEDSFEFLSSDMVVVGIADPDTKENIYNKLKGSIQFLSYVSPGTLVAKFTRIGIGTIICPNCLIGVNASIGNFVTINTSSQIGHDVKVGDYSSIMSNVDIGGHCDLGKKVFVSTGSTIIPGRLISDNVKIGSGSVVLRHIKKAKSVFGNPAKEIK
jgi:sugar O-acyltransferase (sialic acid O-acetyltransferase NeuD family)